MIVNGSLCGYLADVLEMDFSLGYAAIPVRNKEWPKWGFRTFNFSYHAYHAKTRSFQMAIPNSGEVMCFVGYLSNITVKALYP
jgi:hypothetical protein